MPLPAGTILTCDGCGRELYQTIVDLVVLCLDARWFKALNGMPEPLNNCLLATCICGGQWFEQNDLTVRLHTKEGWKP